MGVKELVNFFHEIGKLKGMPRRGWVINDIKNPERITERPILLELIEEMDNKFHKHKKPRI